MEMAYTVQQEVIATLNEIGDHDLADRLRTLYDRSPATPLWRRLAIFLPIASMLLVSPRDDTGMVGGHSLLVGGGHNIEPCHHLDTIPSRLI